MPTLRRSILTTLAASALALGAMVSAFAQDAPTPAAAPGAVPAARQAKNVAIITIHGPIDNVTAASFERRLKMAV